MESFLQKLNILLGDLTKFKAFQLKKAFGVFVTLDEELNPIDISETIESGVWRGLMMDQIEPDKKISEENIVATVAK